ncbi:MAG: uroporphyrinogen-III synthase [Pseudomonadota bacterium]
MGLSRNPPTLLVTRPEPDGSALAAEAEARGWRPVAAPLMRIAPLDASVVIRAGESLAFTSANGVRVFAQKRPERALTVFCVGPASADVARAAEFEDVRTAGGDVEALASLIAEARLGPVIHIGGVDRAGDLVGELTRLGVEARREDVYKAEEVSALSEAALEAIGRGEPGRVWVALFSPRTARIFERATAAQDLGRLGAACLSANVAAALERRERYNRVAIAAAPSTDALLAAAEAEIAAGGL